MSKDKLYEARMAGMIYALGIAKEKGIEGLEEEIRFRNITKVPITVKKEAVDEAIDRVKNCTVDTIRILALMTLKDEFGFGTKRLNQFIERFDSKTDCLVGGYTTWQEQIDTIAAENKIFLDIRRNG